MDSGLVDRAVASETRDPRFESNHRQILFTINCIIKDKNKENEAGNGPFKNLIWQMGHKFFKKGSLHPALFPYRYAQKLNAKQMIPIQGAAKTVFCRQHTDAKNYKRN